MNTKAVSYLIVSVGLVISILVGTTVGQESTINSGATESTPSQAQYFSWINNTNEGTTEEQTIINLEFFQWLLDDYNMKLDIYAFDAGAIDGPGDYGSDQRDKFKRQFPRGFDPIARKARSMGAHLGVWLGPDGFGNTPEEETKRRDMLVGFCRDFGFALFKFDAVCGQLRPEKQGVFIDAMKACRHYSPHLIALNHRLDLGQALPYVTTWLWEGAETYIDVHMSNIQTAPHHRAGALSRGVTPELKRLTEDHGVCLSSCLDYWEDDLILQAFNRGLILAPQIYGNPWLLRDDEFPRLARIYNLHRAYRDILVKGLLLDENRYGPKAVSRGDDHTRFITLRNLTWEPVSYELRLDESLGLKPNGKISLIRFHPAQRQWGPYDYGAVTTVVVLPFRSCLLMATSQPIQEVGLAGGDYEVVRDTPTKPVTINLLGMPGEKAVYQWKAAGRTFKKATLDNRPAPAILTGKDFEIQFAGPPWSQPWHRRLASLQETAVPTDAEAVYEATCFAADNDALEVRSLRRSGPSHIPQVQKARAAFFDQPLFSQRGIWDQYMFDGNPETSFNICRSWEGVGIDLRGGVLRIDMGTILTVRKLTMKTREDQPRTDYVAEVSSNLCDWQKVALLAKEGTIQMTMPDTMNIRYVRVLPAPEKVVDISAEGKDGPLSRESWRGSNLFKSYAHKPAVKAWSASVRLTEAAKNSYLAIAVHGCHGIEGAYAALRVDGRLVGCPDRAVSYPSNVWEFRVLPFEHNYTYYVPLDRDYLNKTIEVVVLAMNPQKTDLRPEVWLTAYPAPYETQTLILE